jgi:hypothetical protein
MTVHRREGTSGLFEKIALVVALCLAEPFAILAFQLVTGIRVRFTGWRQSSRVNIA